MKRPGKVREFFYGNCVATLLHPTGIEPTPFQNSASKVAGLQVHSTTLDRQKQAFFKDSQSEAFPKKGLPKSSKL